MSVNGIFERLARLVLRRPWWVIAAWLVIVAALSVAVPPLMKLASDRNQELLPSNSAVMAATRDMTAAFHEPGIQNIALVVLTDERGLSKADEDVYRTLVDRLHRDDHDVVMVQDFISQPPMREVLASKDNQAWFIPVGIRGELGSPESSDAYKRVVSIVDNAVAGSSLTVHMTGLTATVAEREQLGLRDLRVIETATIGMVLVILFVVYRSIVTILVPLATITLSQAAATQGVAALATWGLPISQQTVVFMSAMMIGAGVDYAVFLISRYHEYLRQGLDSDEAVARALTAIGKVIAASAATVAVTFLGMSFTTLKVFSTTGPALAVTIAIAFLSSITLLPAILTLVGRRGWAKPRKELTSRFWHRSGINIVRHPVRHLVGSLVVLIALAAGVGWLHTSYDARTALPASAASNVGMAAIERHYPASVTAPQYLFIQSPNDLRTTKGLADLEQMAQRVAQLPDIAVVRGVTRPTGAPLEQATLSFQAGEIGDKLAEATNKINGSVDQRQALVGGAGKLADSLATVRTQLTKTMGVMETLNKTMSSLKDQLENSQEFQDAQRELATVRDSGELPNTPPRSGSQNFQDMVAMADALLEQRKSNPGCDSDPDCTQQRDQLQRLSDGLHKMQPSLDAAAKALRSLGGSGGGSGSGGAGGAGGMKQNMASLQEGANALAEGSRKIAEGLRTLDDQTKQLGEGLSHASAFLLAMKLHASEPGAAGFYISPEILDNDKFKDLARVFMSPDGHSARYLVESKLNPYDTKAMDQVKAILAAAQGAQANTSLADAKIAMSGMTPYYAELRDYFNKDLRYIVLMTVIVVFLILVLLLRAVVAPMYLVGTVILSCLSSLGIGVIVLQIFGGQSMAASTPGMAFIVLVAVGADYNMLLISRIRDESPHGIRSGVIRTVRSTGSVITSAGMIFAAPMFAMLFSSIGSMVQGGFIIGVGLLIDTLIVRTVTVPALAVLVGKYNWWPSGLLRKRVATP
ncbi:RND family transporter [Mycobacterium sp. CBMA293]|nr:MULTISPECIES: RND family transporter [unclassified Mycolicibacterium]MUL58984.1 RND family transporter [Mycolicibacterium sp. CBMA 335]MUL69378.1 RND family transporter [Mycolicibacterium sp. CBMA 311]MUM06644.1 MMPL family RND transporter [Mycolicibacterium sp. CBMA 213]MUM11471.1 RND family transporter [Mycolicibacterium sp. CBMA 293]MUL46715.1 RND family transporter [Mycolicibacterium sp. CBMA 360]